MPKDSVESASAGSRSLNSTKRRKLHGPACDICKKKKIKCDSGDRMGRPCTNCETGRHECTYRTATTKSFGISKGYVESLEIRLEKMENILTRFFPGVDLNSDLERLVSGLSSESAGSPPSATSKFPELGISVIPRNDEDEHTIRNPGHIAFKLKNLKLDPAESRFYGKSSGFQLVQTALDLKRERDNEEHGRPHGSCKRPEFWEAPWWEWRKMDQVLEPDASKLEFPEEDLLWSLIDLYFREVNILFPLLHRPTFERQVAEGLHLRALMFGNTVLLVCALGSKFSNDPRVIVKGSGATRSAGHHWYGQVNYGKSSFDKEPSLHELQMYALIILFAKSNSSSHGAWIHTGLAVKMAMEVGAHRRKREQDGPYTLEDELWKRAFWSLFSPDVVMCALTGRPCTLHEEDYDQEYPIDCDDEDWEHPDPLGRLQQPSHRPSGTPYFTCYIRLMEILAKIMHYLYSVRRPGDLLGRAGLKFDQQAIAELDSAMNKWLDCVPDHLRWNPDCKNQLFLKQSALLHCTYYHAQVIIHRPFIPFSSTFDPSSATFPSLTICSTAARSCCCVLDALSRSAITPFPHIQPVIVIAGMILLVNILNGKRSSSAQNIRKEMEHIQMVIDSLGVCERRWGSAGRFRDIIVELASFNDVSLNREQEGNAPFREAIPGEGLLPHPSLNAPTCDVPSNIYCVETTATENENSSVFLTDTTTVGVGVNVEGNPRSAPEVHAPLPMYVGGSEQLSTYAAFEVPDVPIAPGGGLPASDSVHLPKAQPLRRDVFLPSGSSHGSTFPTQASLPDAGDGSAYRAQAVMSEAMPLGQEPVQSDRGSDWQDQERMMAILQMMEGDGMGNWLIENGFESGKLRS